MDWPGGAPIPALWLECNFANISRTTYSALFDVLCYNKGNVTVTIAAPGVFTLTSHGLKVGDRVFLQTTGALPTGLSANLDYYVNTVPSANTFTLGTGRTVPVNGSITGTGQITTTGSQSGTHNIRLAPYGIDDATTFNTPNYGSVTLVGQTTNASGVSAVLGAQHGEGTHALTTAELASHTHSIPQLTGEYSSPALQLGGTPVAAASTIGTGGTPYIITQTSTTGSAGSGTAHNTMQLSTVVKKIIYAGV